MNNLNGGYIMVDVDKSTFNELKGIIKAKKPILVYGLANIPVYASSVVISDEAVVIKTATGVVAFNEDGVTTKVTDITKIPSEVCEALACGDVLVKTTTNQKHAYIVSYKEAGVGMCLTYTDATTVETVSYDYTDGAWVYNSTDKTTLTPDA